MKKKLTEKDYKMLVRGMQLAVTAPTEKQSEECIKIVEKLSNLFPENIVEKAKREVEFWVKN